MPTNYTIIAITEELMIDVLNIIAKVHVCYVCNFLEDPFNKPEYSNKPEHLRRLVGVFSIHNLVQANSVLPVFKANVCHNV